YEKSMTAPGFTIMRPERRTYFATSEMAYLIAKMGAYSKVIAPSHELHIGDVSRKSGGPLGSHKSHENGMDADIAFYFKADKEMSTFANALKSNRPIGDWMMPQQWKLFKYAVSSKYVDMIFIHPTLKQALCRYAVSSGELKAGQKSGDAFETLRRLWPDTGHDDHFHLRIKRTCAKGQKGCIPSPELPLKSGC
ncbi:MAG: penicillin-insensitive murein endopeptidase, partial [Bdellovibrio sp.]|nr:penicillin-insensitive murein endopeptidase [Bdellovibrio sp.]